MSHIHPAAVSYRQDADGFHAYDAKGDRLGSWTGAGPVAPASDAASDAAAIDLPHEPTPPPADVAANPASPPVPQE